MDATITRFFATVLALLGPAPQDTPLSIAEGQRIVAFGDSITAAGGWLRDIDAVFAQQYAPLKLPPLLNRGVSGNRVEDLLGRFGKDVVEHKPATVLICVGLSDVWQRLSQPHKDIVLADYKENLERLVDMAAEAKIRVILVSPTLISEDPQAEGNRRLKLYANAMRQVAEAKKTPFVDVHGAMLTALAKKPPGQAQWLTFDGTHLNDRGNAVMAATVLRTLGVPDEKIAASQPPEGRLTWWPATRPTTAPATTPAPTPGAP